MGKYFFTILLTLFFVFINVSQEHKFVVNRDLRDGLKIPKEEWTEIEVKELCSNDPESLISVDVKVPESIYNKSPKVSIFFANESHSVLQIKFDEKITATLFRIPYEVESVAEGPEICPSASEKTVHLAYEFPGKWLPENGTKINAAVEFPDGSVHNLYGIRNHKISLPDLVWLWPGWPTAEVADSRGGRRRGHLSGGCRGETFCCSGITDFVFIPFFRMVLEEYRTLTCPR